jgi:hypothetical protein
MRFLIFALAATFATTAFAAPKVIKASEMKFTPSDNFSGPLAVGRISPFTFQVELVGMLAVDPTTPARKVKVTLDFTPADVNDSNQVSAAYEMIGKFYDAKRGKRENNNVLEPVAKVIGVTWADADVVNTQTKCIGKDLETVEPVSSPDAGDKKCFSVVPQAVIEYSL